jgi:hypothetical protein
MAKSYYIVLTFILSRVEISGIMVFGFSVAAGAFSLLDTVNMLRVIVYCGFAKLDK